MAPSKRCNSGGGIKDIVFWESTFSSVLQSVRSGGYSQFLYNLRFFLTPDSLRKVSELLKRLSTVLNGSDDSCK